jgi:hypothetical protein
MSDSQRNRLLWILFWAPIAIAVWTLLPLDAPKPNDLGYFSACPFAPWSTLSMLMVAGVVWVIRQYFLTRPPAPPPVS